MCVLTLTKRRGVDFSRPTTHVRGMWVEGRVRGVAGSQHGLIRRSELIDLGVTDREISWRSSKSRVEIVHPGVYYVDSIGATWKTNVLAAVMAAGPDALASHRCAAVLWGLDAIYGRMIEVTVPYLESPEPTGVIVHRTRRPNPGSVLDAIPITPPEKTLLDIAPIVPRRTLEKATRSAIHMSLTTDEKLDLTVRMYGGRGVAGTRALRYVIRVVAEDRSGSVAEIDLRHIVADAPVPNPVQQIRIRLPDGSNAYPDFAWPDRMRIVEVDGFDSHGTPEQLQNDLRRQNQLMELGWEIRRFTATEVRDDPARVLAEVIRFVNRPFREGWHTLNVDRPSQNG